MKKYYIGLCFLAVIAVVSCRKVDDTSVFDKSVDARLNEALKNYQSKLSGAQYGWKASVQTKSGGNYTFYFSFNDSNRVKMLSSFDSTSATTLRESSFRLKALQQPSLIFDTYSYIHALADPNPNVNGGSVGAGLQADFEFYFDDDSSTNDMITLVGRFNGTKTVLTRATQQERTAFLNGDLAKGLAINKILTYYKRIVIGTTDSADMFVNTKSSYVIQPDANGNLLDPSRRANYTLMLGGLTFSKPLQVGSKTVSELSNVVFNSSNNTITATSGGQPIVIKEVVTPIKIDAAAPKRWWDVSFNANDYWISFDGWHSNGVDDFFGFKTKSAYYYFLFWANYGSGFDATGLVYVNASNQLALYAPAVKGNFTAIPGRVVFTYGGTFGTSPNAASTTAMTATTSTSVRTILSNAQGFYLIQTSATSYDMVSASDGKSWISWDW